MPELRRKLLAIIGEGEEEIANSGEDFPDYIKEIFPDYAKRIHGAAMLTVSSCQCQLA
jgi:hypothetical protein